MPPRPPSVIRAVVTAELGAPPEAAFRQVGRHAAGRGLARPGARRRRRRRAPLRRQGAISRRRRGAARRSRRRRRSSAASSASELGAGAADRRAGGDARAAPRRARLRRRGRTGSSASAAPLHRRRRRIVIPRVDAARSTARVLTMERLDGRAIADLAEDDAEARRRGARAIFRFAFGAPLAARHLQRRSAPRQLPGPRRRKSRLRRLRLVGRAVGRAARRRPPPVPRHDPARRRRRCATPRTKRGSSAPTPACSKARSGANGKMRWRGRSSRAASSRSRPGTSRASSRAPASCCASADRAAAGRDPSMASAARRARGHRDAVAPARLPPAPRRAPRRGQNPIALYDRWR